MPRAAKVETVGDFLYKHDYRKQTMITSTAFAMA
jgi:hypothetical protein